MGVISKGVMAGAASTILVAGIVALTVSVPMAQSQGLPERVTFPSADGKTTLVGYLFVPKGLTGRAPAVVMMHGRSGAYSANAKGRYDAQTLSLRHKMWGELWASEGYVAVHVDGFSPRGFPDGFPRFSYEDRPLDVNEVDVRPLDAFGALTWLRGRSDVAADRIVLQGWSNGASATLATMALPVADAHARGFRGALAFYPACGLRDRFNKGLRPSAPVRVFHGTADEEVSYRRCNTLVDRSRKLGGDIEITIYPDATHNFDNPGRERQKVEANRKAKDDSTTQARQFFAERLRAAAK